MDLDCVGHIIHTFFTKSVVKPKNHRWRYSWMMICSSLQLESVGIGNRNTIKKDPNGERNVFHENRLRQSIKIYSGTQSVSNFRPTFQS